MKLSYEYPVDQFAKAMEDLSDPMDRAGAESVKIATESAEHLEQVDIVRAGLGADYARDHKSRFYLNKGLDAAGVVYHTRNYSYVFETGAQIQGRPKLWLPLRTTPQRIGGKRVTAKRLSEEVGHLFKIKIGGREYLAMKVAVSKTNANARLPLLSMAMLRRGARGGKGKRTRLIPMFLGLDATTIRKRTHVIEICKQEAAKIPKHYDKAIRAQEDVD